MGFMLNASHPFGMGSAALGQAKAGSASAHAASARASLGRMGMVSSVIVCWLILSRGAPALFCDVIAVEPARLKTRLVGAEALAQCEFHVALEPPPRRGEMVLRRPGARAEHGARR